MREALRERYSAFDRGRLSRLAIVGAADEGKRLAHLCARLGISVCAIADDNPARCGTIIEGVTVVTVDSLTQLSPDVPVVIASHRPLRLVERLRNHGFRDIALFMALQVMDPERFPPHMFYDGILEDLIKNLDRYHALSAAFQDDKSRMHLDAILGYRQTCDIGTLLPIVDEDVYLPSGLFIIRPDEVYIDAGAYDGDTIRLFIRRVGGSFDRIVAFEPDPETFRRLEANFISEHRVHAIPKGLYSHSTTLRFVGDASRRSIISEHGQIEVPVTSLDEVLGQDRVTFVKMNIEGAELAALDGARDCIKRWRPRLAISAYHRPTDLWRVPFLIRELDSSYSLHLRQHDAGIIETVAYGVAYEPNR
jgi:FkbM family methyltransferase